MLIDFTLPVSRRHCQKKESPRVEENSSGVWFLILFFTVHTLTRIANWCQRLDGSWNQEDWATRPDHSMLLRSPPAPLATLSKDVSMVGGRRFGFSCGASRISVSQSPHLTANAAKSIRQRKTSPQCPMLAFFNLLNDICLAYSPRFLYTKFSPAAPKHQFLISLAWRAQPTSPQQAPLNRGLAFLGFFFIICFSNLHLPVSVFLLAIFRFMRCSHLNFKWLLILHFWPASTDCVGECTR